MFGLWNELFGFPVNSCDYEAIDCNKSYVPILNWDNDNEFVWSLADPLEWGIDAKNVAFSTKDIQKRPASVTKVDQALEHLMSKIENSKSSIKSFSLAFEEGWESLNWTIVYVDDAWEETSVRTSVNLKDMVEWWETVSLQEVTAEQLTTPALFAEEAHINEATIWNETVTTSAIWTATIANETVTRSTITDLTAEHAAIADLDAEDAEVSTKFTSQGEAIFNWTNTFNTDADFHQDINVAWNGNIRTLNVAEVSTFNWQVNAKENAHFDKNVDVDGNTILNTLNVQSYATFTDKATFNEDATFNDTLVANNNVKFNGHSDVNTLNVAGQSTFKDDVDIDHNLNVDGNIVAECNARVDWTLTVWKNAEFQKNVNVLQNEVIWWTLEVAGKSTLNSVEATRAEIWTEEVENSTIANLVVTDSFELPDGALDQFQARSEKSQPNGYASLDNTWKVPMEELPDTVTTGMHYKWTWEPTSNYPANPKQWDFYKVTAEGTHAGIHFDVGDIIIYNGSGWDRIPAGDTVISVNGRTWAVTGLEENSNKVSTLDMVNPSQVEYPSEYAVVTAVNWLNTSIWNVASDLSSLSQTVAGKADAANTYNKDQVDALVDNAVESSTAFHDLQDQVDLLPTKAYVDWQDNLKANVTDVYDKDVMDALLADKAHVNHTHTVAEVSWLAQQLATQSADISSLSGRVHDVEEDVDDLKDDIDEINIELTHKATLDWNGKISSDALPDNAVTLDDVDEAVRTVVTQQVIESKLGVSFRTYTLPVTWTTASLRDDWITARANVLWTWTWELIWHISWEVEDWKITVNSTENEAGNFYVTMVQPV